jgi:hypothetical protein
MFDHVYRDLIKDTLCTHKQNPTTKKPPKLSSMRLLFKNFYSITANSEILNNRFPFIEIKCQLLLLVFFYFFNLLYKI